MSRFLNNSFQKQQPSIDEHNHSKFMNPHSVIHEEKELKSRPSQKHHGLDHNAHYDPLAIPCDWVLASKHALSRRVAVEVNLPNENDPRQPTNCVCCGYQIEREDLDFECDPLDLRFLGSGFPLFYMFIKYSIFILVEFWLLKGMFSLATDLMGDYCYQVPSNEEHKQAHKAEELANVCGGTVWHFISLANVYDRPDLRKYQTQLSLIVVIANIITFQLFRRAQRKIDIEVDESQLTPSDYTCVVKNIPKLKEDYKETLKNMFENYAADGRELIVKKIVLVYNIDEVIELEENVKDLVQEKQAYLQENGLNFSDFKVKQIDERLAQKEHKIHQVEHDLFNNKEKFAGIAFISFDQEWMKQLVITTNQHSSWERVKAFLNEGKTQSANPSDLILEGQKLYVEEAPEPNDIDWEFIHIQTSQKVKARVIAWSISIIFMTGCFFLIWFLSELADKMNEEAEELEKKGIKNSSTTTIAWLTSQSISWTIIFFNKFVIGKVYHLIVDLEKISNKTKFNISFAQKQSVALFINTALISLVIDFFITGNVIGPGGFIYNESNVFLLNAFIPPIVWFIDPWSILQDYKRHKQLNRQKECVLTQDQANSLMEMPDYSQAKRYGDIMKTMWFTFFYGDIIPVGILFSIMGLSLYYFIDKYNVLRRRTIKESLSKHLSLMMIEMLELIIFFSGAGNFVVSMVLFREVNWQDLMILGIAAIYFILPRDDISNILFPLEQNDETVPYDEAKEDFITDYDRENPVTKKEALAELNKHK